MTRRDSEVVLRHMRDALEAISEYTTGGRDEFFRSRLIQDAVIRNLEVLGEAAKQVPNEVRNRHPHIPWRRIAGLRDVLIHQYFGVDLETVWSVVERNVSSLRVELETLVEPDTN